METGFGLGILVILTGSTANSAFGLGLKFTRSWKWEHIWLLFSVTAMILIPWLLGFSLSSLCLPSWRRPNSATWFWSSCSAWGGEWGPSSTDWH